jgi:hypothetical protein
MPCFARCITFSAALVGSTVATAELGSTSYSVEGQLSTYHYEEPGLMELDGSKLGVAARATTTKSNRSFVRAEGRFAGGYVDYDSVDTGSTTGEPDYLFEVRLAGGKSWTGGAADWSWFAGLGYRNLINDSSDKTTTFGGKTYYGYKRQSTYVYLPVGIEVRRPLADERAISAEIEYDHLLMGQQRSYLGETVSNRQHRGHGVRGGIDYSFNMKLSLGIFANVWKIDDSEVVPTNIDFDADGDADALYEPRNRTREIGLRVRYSY